MTRRKTPHPPGTPEDWLNYAKSDLNLALIAKGRRGILPEQVCFHAQQACEKALKAVLALNDIEFPLVHDIEALLDIARQGGVALPPEAESAGMLTPYAVEARYPGYDEAVTPADVEEAIRLAEQVVAWASMALKTRGRHT